MNYKNENACGKRLDKVCTERANFEPDIAEEDSVHILKEAAKNVMILPEVSGIRILATDAINNASFLANYVGIDITDVFDDTLSPFNDSKPANLKEELVLLRTELVATVRILGLLNVAFNDTN